MSSGSGSISPVRGGQKSEGNDAEMGAAYVKGQTIHDHQTEKTDVKGPC